MYPPPVSSSLSTSLLTASRVRPNDVVFNIKLDAFEILILLYFNMKIHNLWGDVTSDYVFKIKLNNFGIFYLKKQFFLYLNI